MKRTTVVMTVIALVIIASTIFLTPSLLRARDRGQLDESVRELEADLEVHLERREREAPRGAEVYARTEALIAEGTAIAEDLMARPGFVHAKMKSDDWTEEELEDFSTSRDRLQRALERAGEPPERLRFHEVAVDPRGIDAVRSLLLSEARVAARKGRHELAATRTAQVLRFAEHLRQSGSSAVTSGSATRIDFDVVRFLVALESEVDLPEAIYARALAPRLPVPNPERELVIARDRSLEWAVSFAEWSRDALDGKGEAAVGTEPEGFFGGVPRFRHLHQQIQSDTLPLLRDTKAELADYDADLAFGEPLKWDRKGRQGYVRFLRAALGLDDVEGSPTLGKLTWGHAPPAAR